jgi:hypothetical protein
MMAKVEAVSIGNALLDEARVQAPLPRHSGNVPSRVIPLPGRKYELLFTGYPRPTFGYELVCEVTNLRNGRTYTAKPTSRGSMMKLGMSDYRVLAPDDFDGLELERGQSYRWRWANAGYGGSDRTEAAGTFTS